MADVRGLHTVAADLARHLTRAHQISPIKDTSCTFQPVGTSELKKLDGDKTVCALLLYRITHNEHTRNLPNAVRNQRMPLSLDLHFLVSVWAAHAQDEQLILAWVIRELHAHPVLDSAILRGPGGFRPDDRIQLIPEELTLDDLTKLWQALVPPMRPSVSYVVRNVRIDLGPVEEAAPVVATRFSHTDEMEPS
jgi:hypothetical protein